MEGWTRNIQKYHSVVLQRINRGTASVRYRKEAELLIVDKVAGRDEGKRTQSDVHYFSRK